MTAPHGKHLPPEIAHHIISFLFHDQSSNPRTNLQLTCRAFYKPFTLRIYRHLHLNEHVLTRLIGGFLEKERDGQLYIPMDWFDPINMAPTVDSLNSDNLFVPSQLRRRSLLTLVKRITITDNFVNHRYYSTYSAIASSIFANTSKRLFPNLKDLCVKGRGTKAGPIWRFLEWACRPSHLCIHDPRSGMWPTNLVEYMENNITNVTIQTSFNLDLPPSSQARVMIVYTLGACDPSCERTRRDPSNPCQRHSNKRKAQEIFTAGIKESDLDLPIVGPWKIRVMDGDTTKAERELQKIKVEFDRLVLKECCSLDGVVEEADHTNLTRGDPPYIRQCAVRFIKHLRWMTPDDLRRESRCQVCEEPFNSIEQTPR
nr:hypothetical protein I302_04985 [Kwoniella bestiolae CBS 10118]OCF25174.1 hypothetical protein I302_04985 [Kwoniella bestiolae CBS 10118]